MRRKGSAAVVAAKRAVVAAKLKSIALRSLAILAAAVALVPAAPRAASAQINCNNVAQSIPGGPVANAFNIWGPSAVCGAAGSVTSLTAAMNNASSVFLTHTSAFVGSPPGAPNSPAGGVWIRGIGGTADVTATGTFSLSGALGAFPSVNIDSKAKTEYAGFQGGVDIARLNMGASGWNGHIGLTGGFMGADNSGLAGQGTSETDLAFGGIYGVLTHSSGFFSDLLVRWDRYSTSVNNTNIGLTGQSFDASGASVTAGAGYNFKFGNGWFVEPSAGIIWSRLDVDSLFVPGAALPFGMPSGTLTFDDVHSLLGRVGVRVGTTFTTPTLALQPYAVVNLWHEFEDSAASSFTCTGCPFTLNTTTTRVGTYGQYGLGLAGQVLNTGWLGYGRFDYRKGDNIDGWGVSAGLRYQWQAAGPSGLVVKAR